MDSRMKVTSREDPLGFVRTAIVIDERHPDSVAKDPEPSPSGQIDLVDSHGHLWGRLQVHRYIDGSGAAIDIVVDPESNPMQRLGSHDHTVVGRSPHEHDVRYTANIGSSENTWVELTEAQSLLAVEVKKR